MRVVVGVGGNTQFFVKFDPMAHQTHEPADRVMIVVSNMDGKVFDGDFGQRLKDNVALLRVKMRFWFPSVKKATFSMKATHAYVYAPPIAPKAPTASPKRSVCQAMPMPSPKRRALMDKYAASGATDPIAPDGEPMVREDEQVSVVVVHESPTEVVASEDEEWPN
jgi:hypothetical protein